MNNENIINAISPKTEIANENYEIVSSCVEIFKGFEKSSLKQQKEHNSTKNKVMSKKKNISIASFLNVETNRQFF